MEVHTGDGIGIWTFNAKNDCYEQFGVIIKK